MKVKERCAACLFDRQRHLTEDSAYLQEVRQIIDDRRENDSAPYLVYLFSQAYERHFGAPASYAAQKKTFNDLALSMEDAIQAKIEASDDPLSAALLYARIGNYIDFGATDHVEESTFLALFDGAVLSDDDRNTIASFVRKCERAQSFLLVADNCGEIVFDKLFLEQLKKRFPNLTCSVMVRGGEFLNDVTEEDASYVGIDSLASIVSNGKPVAGTICELLPEAARSCLDRADVILAKGQGNYESLCGQGRNAFYSFLCKCGLFTERFHVPFLTGLFIEEGSL